MKKKDLVPSGKRPIDKAGLGEGQGLSLSFLQKRIKVLGGWAVEPFFVGAFGQKKRVF